MKRKPLGKRLRFSIFERDCFTCQYCGKTPPEIVLVIDHILPVASGGTNDKENLRTSCEACNQGKHSKVLGTDTVNPMEALRRHQELSEEQILAEQLAEAIKVREETREKIVNLLCGKIDRTVCKKRNVTTIINAINEFGVESALSWLDIAANTVAHNHPNPPNETDLIKYFCGIAGNRRREVLNERYPLG